MKNSKIIVAKVSVVILTIFLVGISLLKLVDSLNKPISRFHDTIDATYKDMLSVLRLASSNELYKAIDADSFEIAIDSKVSAENLGNTNYSNYADIINNGSFITNIKYDRKENYLNGTLNINSETNPYTINYIENKNIKFLYANGEKPTRLTSDTKLKAFDPNKTSYVIDVIKSELDKTIKDADIKTNTTAIAINGKTYDVGESSYTFSGTELKYLISSIEMSLINNSNTISYLMDIYGVNRNEVKSQLSQFIDSLNIDTNTNYVLKAYVNNKTNVPLKLLLCEDNESAKEIVAYTMENDYHKLEIRRNNLIHFISLDKLNNVYSLMIQNDKELITIAKTKENDKTTGKITITDPITKKDHETIEYSYMLTANSNGTTSMALNLVVEPTYISKDIKATISSSILITKNTTVTKENIIEYDTESTGTMFINYVDKYLELYASSQTSPLGE